MTKQSALLLVGAVLLLFLSRYPGWMADRPLNVDESVMAAGALTLQAQGIVPWRDFDLPTVGPVTMWFLAGAAALGVPMNYQGLHFLAALVWAATGVLVLVMVRMACGGRAAVFAFILLLGVSFSAWRPDYLHFTSEALPAMLLAGAAWLVVVPLTREMTARGGAVAALFCGVLCALAVLAKLQAAPVAAFLGAAALLPALRHGWRRVLAAAVAVAVGGLVPVALLGAWLSSGGLLSLALQSYVFGGASYGASQSLGIEWLGTLARDLVFGWWALRPFFPALVLAAVLLVLLGWRPWPPTDQRVALGWFFAGWFAAALAALVAPSFRFEHHGIFLVAPATVLLVFLVSEAVAFCRNANSRPRPLGRLVRGYPGLVLAGFLALWFAVAAPRMIYSLRGKSIPMREFPNATLAEVCRIVDETAAPGAPIAVWGWAPEINVLTGRPSASRHIISHFLIEENAVRETHRGNFLADLDRSRPAVIVDAVAPGFFTWPRWRADYGAHRAGSFPELADFLAENYRELARLAHEGAADEAIVYVRVDRD